MTFAKPSGAQTKTTNRYFEKTKTCFFQNLAERKPKRLTVLLKNQGNMSYGEKTNRNRGKKKSKTKNGHETPFLMSK